MTAGDAELLRVLGRGVPEEQRALDAALIERSEKSAAEKLVGRVEPDDEANGAG